MIRTVMKPRPTNPSTAPRRSPAQGTAARVAIHLDPVRSGERGQATAEYALVMLAAAALAGLLLSWVVGTDGISRLLNAVMDSIVGDVSEALPEGP